jgi:hypothetical protein
VTSQQGIILFWFCAFSLSSQTGFYGGALRGTVEDDSGGRVEHAKISLVEESKGFERICESDSGGAFLFTPLTAGTYAVQVEKGGFQSERVHNLRIEVGEEAALAITLHVGASHTELTVQPPSSTELDAGANTLGSVVDSGRVQELPLNGRYFLELAELAGVAEPVSSVSNLFTTNVGPPERTIILPGTLPNSVSYYLNGINITGSRDGELALSPSIAAVDQLKVDENFLMPDEGVNPALVNIVTRSGSNRFHGEAYEFLRNRDLDARSFFAAERNDVKLNQFGAAVGGPIVRSRLWFYGFYEGLRQLTAFPSAGYTPTVAMFRGDFSAAGTVIYDPETYNPAANTREPFPGGFQIPASRLNPVSQNLLRYYLPGKSLQTTPSNVFGNPRATQADDQGGLRLDAALNSRSQLFGQFFRQSSPTDMPGLFPFSGLLYLNSSNLGMLQHTVALSPRAVNILRLGFLRNVAVGGNEAQDDGPNAASIGIANTFSTRGVPAVNLQGYSSFGRANGEIGNRDNTWQLDEEFAYAKGAHSFAFGAGVQYRRGWHWNGNGSALGSLSFQPVFTAQLSTNAQGQMGPVANTGNAFADFLLGIPAIGMLNGLPAVQFRSIELHPYFQDSWRLAPNLTVNFGLAWSLETPPQPQGWARQYIHSFNFDTGLLAFAALGQTSYRPIRLDKDNVSPRLGLAWSPGFLKGAVIRAAAGLYYSEFPWVLAGDSVQGPPAGVGQTFANALSAQLPSYALGLNIFSPSPAVPLTPTYAANLPTGTTIQAVDPNFRIGAISQWNASIEKGLRRTDSVELDYLGSSGHDLPNLSDLSQCRPAANLFCDLATRPYPRYGLFLYANSSGNSSYEALAVKYEHRAAAGLNVHIEYAFAKALADTWQSSLTLNQLTDCRKCAKGPASFDVRQKAVGSLVWSLPIGRDKHFGAKLPRWADMPAGGWSLSAITTFSTGQPVPLTAPNQTGSAFIRPLPNRVCDGRSRPLGNDVRTNGMLWFDGSCFPTPAPEYFGNSGATVLAGPGINNWDLGLQKTFAVGEAGAKLDMRAEFFNAWNHTQFDQPNGNSGAGVNFGRISAALPPRLVQVALKLRW